MEPKWRKPKAMFSVKASKRLFNMMTIRQIPGVSQGGVFRLKEF